MAESWRCPYCGNMATIGTYDIAEAEVKSTDIPDVVDRFAAGIRIVKCPNPDCSRLSVYSSVEQRSKYNAAVGEARLWQLIPEASVRNLPDYIPEAIRQDYAEAFLIKDKSPKASATLARRCLQGMVRDFWGVKPSNLYSEIRELEGMGRVDPQTLDSLDAVRKVGNIGAHMENDVNVIVEVTEGEAEILLALIDSLVDDWYVARHGREERSKRLKEIVASKDEQRNGL